MVVGCRDGRGVRWAFASSWRHLRGLPSGWKGWEVWGLVASLDSRLQSVVRGARLARVEGSLRPWWSPFSADCSLGTGSTCLSFRRVPAKEKKSAPCETKRERNVGGVDQKGESWADRTIHEIIVVKEVDECRQPNQWFRRDYQLNWSGAVYIEHLT